MDGRNPRFDFTAPVPDLVELGRVHLIAIGGSGMSAVARVMLARGVPVSGSDAADTPMLRALEREGARVFVGHDPAQVTDVDTVVISSAIREENPELAAARAAGLRVLHRAQGLAAAMGDSIRVAVAGANGKTTTTSMLTVALESAGAQPSFAAGGQIAGLGTNARYRPDGPFVVEADESDGSFLSYRPHVAVVTNVQPDHLDFYGTVERVETAYADFAASIQPGGLLVACHDDAGSRRLAQARREVGERVLTYGVHEDADVRLVRPRSAGMTGLATLVHDGAERDLRLSVPGLHNLQNATAAYAAATVGLAQEPDAVLSGLAGYAGTGRRFESRGEAAGVRVVDDYAHNGPKVAAVVRTARELVGQGRLIVVFQPHLYSRTRDFADLFAEGLAPADVVVLMDVYGAREQPMPGVSSELIAGPLRRLAPSAEVVVGPSRDSIPALVAQRARPGDLVLTVGAGDVTALGPQILAALGS